MSLLDELDKWQNQGLALRERLLEERKAFHNRLEEIEWHLQRMPVPHDDADHAMVRLPDKAHLSDAELKAWAARRLASTGAPLSEVVRSVLRFLDDREFHSLADVVNRVLLERPKADVSAIERTLKRLVKKGQVEARGERAQIQFRWKGSE